MSRLTIAPLPVLALFLLLAGCGDSEPKIPPAKKPGASKVKSAPTKKISKKEVDALARVCLKNIVADITAIKGKHPELTGWRADPIGGLSFEHSHNYSDKADGRLKVDPRFGPAGCHIWVAVKPSGGMQRDAEYHFPNLDVDVHARVAVAKDGNKAVQKEIRSIVKKRLEPLAEANRQYRVERKK